MWLAWYPDMMTELSLLTHTMQGLVVFQVTSFWLLSQNSDARDVNCEGREASCVITGL